MTFEGTIYAPLTDEGAAWVAAMLDGIRATDETERTPTVHYMPCPNHQAAIEVEGYCPCFDGLEIDWNKTDIWRNE